MAEFKVGDRVRVTKEDFECIVGEEGTVISYEDDFSIGVRFDRFSSGKHACGGDCEEGYGWYVAAKDIELISENKFSIGDTVKIVSTRLKRKSYDKTIDKIGVIDRTYTNKNGSLSYGVRFSDFKNPQSRSGCFWFVKDCLERFVSEVKPLPDEYVVHTETLEQAEKLCEVFKNEFAGQTVSMLKPTQCWNLYDKKTGYNISNREIIGYADVPFYKSNPITFGEVIEFDEWLTRIGSKDNKINIKENNDMWIFRSMHVEVDEAFIINKKDNTKDKYMVTTVSTSLGKASVTCAVEDYNKDEGVFLACAKITANQNEETMMLWHIAMDTWGSKTSMSILSRLADRACIGSFDKAYRNYLKKNELEYKKSCICKTCGTKFETPELAREHEKWHVDHKREKHEAYLIRKEAKKRIAEAEREGKIETVMSEIFAKKEVK